MKKRTMNQDSSILAEPDDPMAAAQPTSSYQQGPESNPAALLGHGLGGIGPAPVGYYIEGTEAADHLYGSNLADDIFGLGGHDILHGGLGNDRLEGGEGNDMLGGGAGADTLIGGLGNDTVSYAGSSDASIDLLLGSGYSGDAAGDTYSGIENVIGSSFGDVIGGTDFDNVLNGGAGDDEIAGFFGRDILIGGAGHDTLTGGDDVGGVGDTFVFTPGSGVDHITDFHTGYDKIDLTAFTAHLGTAGDMRGFFGTEGQLAIGYWDEDRIHATGLDETDAFFFDTRSSTLFECRFEPDGTIYVGSTPPEDAGMLYLLNPVLTIDKDDAIGIQADDFLIL